MYTSQHKLTELGDYKPNYVKIRGVKAGSVIFQVQPYFSSYDKMMSFAYALNTNSTGILNNAVFDTNAKGVVVYQVKNGLKV